MRSTSEPSNRMYRERDRYGQHWDERTTHDERDNPEHAIAARTLAAPDPHRRTLESVRAYPSASPQRSHDAWLVRPCTPTTAAVGRAGARTAVSGQPRRSLPGPERPGDGRAAAFSGLSTPAVTAAKARQGYVRQRRTHSRAVCEALTDDDNVDATSIEVARDERRGGADRHRRRSLPEASCGGLPRAHRRNQRHSEPNPGRRRPVARLRGICASRGARVRRVERSQKGDIARGTWATL